MQRNLTDVPLDVFYNYLFPMLGKHDLYALRTTSCFFRYPPIQELHRKKQIKQVVDNNYDNATILLTGCGDVWVFGHNAARRLGLATPENILAPTKILTGVASVISKICGLYFIMQEKQRLLMTGNYFTGENRPPIYSTGIEGVAEVVEDVCGSFLLILLKDGHVTRMRKETILTGTRYVTAPKLTTLNVENVKQIAVWNEFGQLFLHFDGTLTVHKKGDNSPQQILGLPKIRKIVGDVLITHDNLVMEFKANEFVPIPNLTDIRDAYCTGISATYFITTSNRVYGRSWNLNGQLGLGHTNSVNVPELIDDLHDVDKIFSDRTTTFFLLKDGNVLTCGVKQFRDENEPHQYLKPIPVPELKNIISLLAASQHSDHYGHRSHLTSVDANGNVMVQGDNCVGQIGLKGETRTKDIIPLPFFAQRKAELDRRFQVVMNTKK